MFDFLDTFFFKNNGSESKFLIIGLIMTILCFTMFKMFVYFWTKVYPNFKKKEHEQEEEIIKRAEKIFIKRDEIADRMYNIIIEISKMREMYAEKNATKEELKELYRELRELEKEVMRIKGHMEND